ncbi:DUF2147 domain-containing protein [Qipengyuania sp. JC766]|uniref:DUF2147 domain-containing protein n=1 Tax=Qipengyuania sp. JC766 TaxID=3232139 RepID=UPI003457FEBF
MRHTAAITALAGATLAFAGPAHAAPESIAGNWKTDDGNAIVNFYKCGSGMCGKITRFLVAEPEGGERDRKNPDKSKRDRPVKGLTIFWSLTPDGDEWDGKGYSPKEGRYFNAELQKVGNRLKIKGCVAVFCRTAYFTKA